MHNHSVTKTSPTRRPNTKTGLKYKWKLVVPTPVPIKYPTPSPLKTAPGSHRDFDKRNEMNVMQIGPMY
jgi:hypothetical protein